MKLYFESELPKNTCNLTKKSWFDMQPIFYEKEQLKLGDIVIEVEPTISEVMTKYFMHNEKEVYGYHCGITALNEIHGTTQVPGEIRIRSNKVNVMQRYSHGSMRFTVCPASTPINKKNSIYLQIMDTIEESYDFFEEDVVDTVQSVVKELKLNKKEFENISRHYSERTLEVIKNVFA